MRFIDPIGAKERTIETDIRRLFARGIDLFNREDYFAAHEVWEDAWQQEQGERRRFLQGLIQVAAGFVKLQRRQPRGAKSLLKRGAENITAHADNEFGLDLPPLLESVSKWRDVADRMEESGEYDPGKLPPPRVKLSGHPDA
jgi:predicted metal-dependent hydrolase